eukprot:scaffold19328_cov213-Skeletonema_marinoi.AAC.1
MNQVAEVTLAFTEEDEQSVQTTNHQHLMFSPDALLLELEELWLSIPPHTPPSTSCDESSSEKVGVVQQPPAPRVREVGRMIGDT